MLPPELKRRALKRARDRGVSFGELVRESLTAALAGQAADTDSLLGDRALFEGKTPSGLSAEHDRHLYDEPA